MPHPPKKYSLIENMGGRLPHPLPIKVAPKFYNTIALHIKLVCLRNAPSKKPSQKLYQIYLYLSISKGEHIWLSD